MMNIDPKLLRNIARNVAVITSLFIVIFSVMMAVNYIQTRGSLIHENEVLAQLKVLSDQNSENTELFDQIRQLDLMARKAFFVNKNALTSGIFILVVLFIVLVVSLRIYYDGLKDLPDKEIDPIDDWAMKTLARKYVRWTGIGFAVMSVMFIMLNMELYSLFPGGGNKEVIADVEAIEQSESAGETTQALLEEEVPAADVNADGGESLQEDAVETADVATPAPVEVSKVTHNAFRGNNGGGHSAAKNVPVQWDVTSGKNIAWNVKIPLTGHSSPVINGNHVFVTGANNQSRELYCFELSSGKLLWTAKADNIPGSPSVMPKTSHGTGLAASTVSTNGSVVCAIFATGDVMGVDMNGKRLWAKNLGVPDNHYGYASSLLMYGKTLFIQYDNTTAPALIALDAQTGNERWRKARPSDKIAWGSPIIAQVGGKPQLVLMGLPNMTAYNPSTGEQLWKLECFSGEVGASPTAANGVVFGASEYSSVVAINAADGSLLWKSEDFLPEVSSPVATANHLYVTTSYGMLACYDAKTGKVVKEVETGGEFYSSPMIVEGKIYIMDNSGRMYIFRADAECAQIASFNTGLKGMTTPAFTDGKVVVRTETNLYCVSSPN